MTEHTPVIVNPDTSEPAFEVSEVVKLGAIRRFLGRVGVSYELPEDFSDAPATDKVLDEIAGLGEGPVSLPGDDESAQRLLRSFAAGPRLQEPLFMKRRTGLVGEPVASVVPTDGNQVRLPVDNFVYAQGLEDWTGKGRVKLINDQPQKSRRVIRDYASNNSTMPPIGIVTAYTQPNGLTFFASEQDGAHRLAAAKARGDEFIDVGGTLKVYELDQDVIPLPEEPAKAQQPAGLES